MCIWHSSQELVYLRPSIHIEACSQNSEKQLLASSRLSVWPSTCMEQHSYQHKFSRNFIIWRHMYIYDNILLSSSDSEKFFKQKLLRKSKHTFYVQQLFLENCVIYKIMWKSMVEPDRPQMTNIVWCKHFACWITKAHTHTHTHTLRTHNIYCFSITTMVVQMQHSVTPYIHWLSCWKYQHQTTTFPVIHKDECYTLHNICRELTITIPIKMCTIKNIPALVIALSSVDTAGFIMHCICTRGCW